MKHSEDRILTTHAGSLPRPERLEQLLNSATTTRRSTRTSFAVRWRTPSTG